MRWPEWEVMYLRYREPVWESGESAESGTDKLKGRLSTARRRRVSTAGVLGAAARATPPGQTLPTIELHGVKLHAIRETAVITHILNELDSSRGGVVVTPNLDHLRRYRNDMSFGALIVEANLVVADGMPLVWASRLQGTPLPERVPGSNLISTLTCAAGNRGRSVFLLGGDPGTANEAADAMRAKFPNCIIAGTYCPPFGFQDDPKQMSLIIQTLSDAKPDIVFVALGSPKQEKLIHILRPILPNAWWLGVGNSFSFLAGRVKRAPVFMQRIGLEWMHRLFQEPKRLFRRYLIVGLPFAARLLTHAAGQGALRKLRRLRSAETLIVPSVEETPLRMRAAPEIEMPLIPRPVLEAPTVLINTNQMPPRALSGLRAMILLGGAVRATQLSSCTRRSLLDLPLDSDGTILNHWLLHARAVSEWAALSRLPVRVMVNQNAIEPVSADARQYAEFRVERDLSEYRGTGGVLRDLTAEYEDDDLILVANAAQVLLEPLQTIAAELYSKKADVAVVAHEDGTPSGLMLIRCKALRQIAVTGFVDMKEQALPLIASSFNVRVMQRRRPTGLPVRSLNDYIQALRFHHRGKSGRPASADPLAEDWSPTFSLVEPGAKVDASARLHDSVVLKDAVVEPGAVVVRSIVCVGATLGRDKSAVDQLVTESELEQNTRRRRKVGASR